MNESNFYNENIDLTGHPIIDDENFEKFIGEKKFQEFTSLAISINKKGFGILKIKSPKWIKLIDQVKKDMENLVNIKSLKEGKIERNRFQDAWLHEKIESVKCLACNNEILRALEILYGRKPFPFQTLNFPIGSSQKLHTDSVHFHSEPKGFMCGVWVALEDVSEDSGPLFYYPGSHKLPYINSRDLGISSAQIENEEHPQKFFEQTWEESVEKFKFQKNLFIAKKGDVLIWHANLIHGGENIKKIGLTRWSQVNHYYFHNCAYKTPFLETIDNFNGSSQWRYPFNLKEC